jgi:hypothetical protein
MLMFGSSRNELLFKYVEENIMLKFYPAGAAFGARKCCKCSEDQWYHGGSGHSGEFALLNENFSYKSCETIDIYYNR